MSAKLLRIFAIWVLMFLAIAASLVALDASKTKRKADRLLAEIRATRTGDWNMDRLYRLADQYEGRAVGDHGQAVGRDKCLTAGCRIDFEVTNYRLSRLHLAPWTAFGVSFFVEKGRTTRMSLWLMSQIRGPSYYFRRLLYGEQNVDTFICGASVQEDSEPSDPPEYYDTKGYKVVARRDWRNRPEKIIVRLAPTVDAAGRERALGFNLGCLSKLGGCQDASELLPAVWDEHDAVVVK